MDYPITGMDDLVTTDMDDPIITVNPIMDDPIMDTTMDTIMDYPTMDTEMDMVTAMDTPMDTPTMVVGCPIMDDPIMDDPIMDTIMGDPTMDVAITEYTILDEDYTSIMDDCESNLGTLRTVMTFDVVSDPDLASDDSSAGRNLSALALRNAPIVHGVILWATDLVQGWW